MKTEDKLKIIRSYGEHHLAFRDGGGVVSYIKSITFPDTPCYHLGGYKKDKNESIDDCYLDLHDRMWNCICED